MFVAALKKSCLTSAYALGADINRISWLMGNQSAREHEEKAVKTA
jgi:hypothetical protein